MARDIRTDPGVLTKPAAPEAPPVDAKKKAPKQVEAGEAAMAPAEPASADKRPIEAHLLAAKLSRPLRAALLAHTRWGQGQRVTDEQFAQARAVLTQRPAREV